MTSRLDDTTITTMAEIVTNLERVLELARASMARALVVSTCPLQVIFVVVVVIAGSLGQQHKELAHGSDVSHIGDVES